MSYVVLARKYRPRRFADLVGQETVARTLRRAVAEDRVAHAYLFSGPHGVGKTSAARVLAKALICPDETGGEPCGECEACRAIAAGRDLDVLEIDGASNRKVEEIESLRESVDLAASRGAGSPKIYIIDEVHQLSRHAFNALLKTLEEPPGHVTFIFATTEPAKVLETIHSRCQRFQFRRVGPEDIRGLLASICEKESIEATDDALRLLAHRAAGAVRDALVGLDRAVALLGEEIDGEELREALGLVPDEAILGLLDSAAEGDVAGLLGVVQRAHAGGFDLGEFVSRAVQAFRGAMLCASGVDEEALASVPWPVESIRPAARELGLDGATYAVDCLSDVRRDLSRAPDPRLVLELALIKIARAGALRSLPEIVRRLEALEGGSPSGPPPTTGGPRPSPEGSASPGGAGGPGPGGRPDGPTDDGGGGGDADPRGGEVAGKEEPGERAPLTGEVLEEAWPTVVDRGRDENRFLGTALEKAKPGGVEDGRAIVLLDGADKMGRKLLKQTEQARTLARVIRDATGRACKGVDCRTRTDESGTRRISRADIRDDPSVKKVVDRFGGSIDQVDPEGP